jgi:hypothetical protein
MAYRIATGRSTAAEIAADQRLEVLRSLRIYDQHSSALYDGAADRVQKEIAELVELELTDMEKNRNRHPSDRLERLLMVAKDRFDENTHRGGPEPRTWRNYTASEHLERSAENIADVEMAAIHGTRDTAWKEAGDALNYLLFALDIMETEARDDDRQSDTDD